MKNLKTGQESKEPSEKEIRKAMKDFKLDWYNAREKAREIAYGGKPPGGYASWGDYWKAY